MEQCRVKRKKPYVKCEYVPLVQQFDEYIRKKKFCEGTFTGCMVIVKDSKDATYLYKKGFFGKMFNETIDDCEKQSHNNIHDQPATNDQLSTDFKKNGNKILKLSLQEAFFLKYVFNVLQIKNECDVFLNVDDLWKLFCSINKNFIEKYIVYHYFRSKGWIVRSGEKFGGDFVLYKMGPDYCHSSYIVVIDTICQDEKNTRVPLKWSNVVPLIRVSESSGKEVLIARLEWPNGVTLEQMQESLSYLPQFSIYEIVAKRWQIKQNLS